MRILFVAMANSIHTARWISQLEHQGWDIHLFPVQDAGIHRELRDLTIHDFLCFRPSTLHPSVRLAGQWPLPRGSSIAKRVVRRIAPAWNGRARRLARTIDQLRPDLVHTLEMQLASYTALDAMSYLRNGMPRWIYSSWGSDLFFYRQKPEHLERIRKVLASCNYYIADCQRDVLLARDLGFKGEVLGVFPTAGGYDIQRMHQFPQISPVSSRRVVALKGYHADNWAGRALVALQALHQCADCLTGYTIEVYLASDNVRYVAEYIARITGLRITVLPFGSHDEIVKLMGRARIAIGASVTDGTPNSMLETMIMGAFPIQSDTVSTAEWITHGENGLLVEPEDPAIIAAAIRRALADDALVDHAAELNARLTAERIDYSVIQPQVVTLYERVAAQPRDR